MAEESAQRWMQRADVDGGMKDAQSTSEQAEVVLLRGRMRRLEMENEMLRRAAAYLASWTVPR